MNELNEFLLPMAEDWYGDDQNDLVAANAGRFEYWIRKGALRDGTLDWSDHQTATRPQGRRQTCVMFALVSAMEARYRRLQRDLLLSPQYAIWRCNESESRRNWCGDGPMRLSAAKHLKNGPICEESVAPYGAYKPGNCAQEPSRAQHDAAKYRIDEYVPLRRPKEPEPNVRTITMLKGILKDGFEFVLVLAVDDVGDCNTMLEPKPGYPDLHQAHAVLVFASRDEGEPHFVCKDSLKGCEATISHDYVRHYALAGVVVRKVKILP